MNSCLLITISSVLQSFCNFEKNLGRSGKLSFFIIYKFWQNCASFRHFLDLIFKTDIIYAFIVHVKLQGDLEVWNHHLYSKSCFHMQCVVRQKKTWLKCVSIYADNVTVLILLPGTVTIHGITAGALFRKCLWTHNCNLVKIIFAVIMTLLNQAGPICVHIMITELLWHMQNCDLIGLLFFR